MRLRLKSIYSGPAGSHGAGSVVDFPEAEGAALLAGGFAEPAADAGEPETATAAPSETATAAPQRRARRSRARSKKAEG